MTTDAVQTMIPTLDVTERPAPRAKVEAGVKLRGAEKVARIPVKIIPTTELPKKPDWIRVRIPVSPEVDRIKAAAQTQAAQRVRRGLLPEPGRVLLRRHRDLHDHG
jgi:hypothetical protein